METKMDINQRSTLDVAIEKAKGTHFEVYDDELVMAVPVNAILDALVILEKHGYTTNFERDLFEVFRPASKRRFQGKLSHQSRFKAFLTKLEPEAAAALDVVRTQLLTTPDVKEGHQNLFGPQRRVELLSPTDAGLSGEIKVVLAHMAIFYTIGCKVSDQLLPREELLGYITDAERTVMMQKWRFD
jgi:hypothetical protein